ncbi:MAG: thioredoxin family protein [Actinomycetia bacterium]|nr:thioredoxin family protein [Actinomycetes bacterium]
MPTLMEVFSGDPPCPGCVAVLAMADRYAERYPAEELTVKKYVGRDALEKYEAYNLSCVPAIVVNGVIKIEGIAPDEGTVDNALREGGLWIR